MVSYVNEVSLKTTYNSVFYRYNITYTTKNLHTVDRHAMCKYSVTLAEFRRFIEASGYQTDAEKKASAFLSPMVRRKKGKE